jgi:prefoldin subunit 5
LNILENIEALREEVEKLKQNVEELNKITYALRAYNSMNAPALAAAQVLVPAGSAQYN